MSICSRLKKAESTVTEIGIDDRIYIDAYKRYYAGLDDGESINALPPLPMRPTKSLNFAEANILALSELDKAAQLKGRAFRAKLGKNGRYVDGVIPHV
jgi:hypothetical protein